MTPARGVTFVRKIETSDQLGSIVVPDQTIDRMTAMQFEVVAVGAPEWCDDEDCRRPHGSEEVPNQPRKARKTHDVDIRLREGAWVLLSPRSWVETPQRDLYAIQTDSVLGVYGIADLVTDV